MHKPLILIVDHSPTDLDILVNALQETYNLAVVLDGDQVIAFAKEHHPDLILVDVIMPGKSGFEICASLKRDPATQDSAIFLMAIGKGVSITIGLELGAIDFISKPFDIIELQARLRTHIALLSLKNQLRDQNLILQSKVEEKTAELQAVLDSVIKTIASLAEERDPYTAGHQKRVADLAQSIAIKMELSAERQSLIRIAGLMHDIGKIRIPVDILNRPGKLLPAEMSMLRVHPEIGFNLLNNIQFSQPVAQLTLQHHERLDGTGYPQGIAGDAILLEARILAVADVVEAMSSHRPYRPALGIQSALDEIRSKSGTWFDPLVVNACCQLFEKVLNK